MSLKISLVQQLEQHRAETCDVRFSVDGKRLLSSDGNALYQWQCDAHGRWNDERTLPFREVVFDVVLDDRFYVLKKECLQIHSLEDGKNIVTISWLLPTSCAFSPDGQWMVTNDTTGHILIWNLLTSHHVSAAMSSPYDGELVNGASRIFRFTPDGQRLLLRSTSHDGNIQMWYFDAIQQELLLQKTFRHGCMSMTISPDGKLLAMIVSNQKMNAYKEDFYVYDLDSLKLLHVFPQTTNGRYYLLAFSPDSRSLMSCKPDGGIDIFSVVSFERIYSFAAHPGLSSDATNPIGGLDWSRTSYIATGGAGSFEDDPLLDDYTIKIWKVENGV